VCFEFQWVMVVMVVVAAVVVVVVVWWWCKIRVIRRPNS
jgi:hypothetical protein